MRRTTSRFLAAMLSVVLSVSALDMSAFAQKDTAAESATEITVSGNDILTETEWDEELDAVTEEALEEETLEEEALSEEEEGPDEAMTLEELFEADLTEEEFLEELAKIEINCEENPEEYAMWKMLMTDPASFYGISLMSLNDAPANNIIGNEYVEFWASNGTYNIGTTGGNPALSSDDYKKMIYGHPGSSTTYTTIRVGGNSYKYSANNEYFDVDNKTYKSSNTFDGVTIIQEITIVRNKSTNREDVVQIKYTAKNTSDAPISVGARIMMDTMLGNNDAVPFKIPGVGSVTTETQYSGSAIPKYWQAFDSLTNPGVISQGRFIIDEYTSPDVVQFTNWRRAFDAVWNYRIYSGSNNNDSAVSAIWNERSLGVGESYSYVTQYGLSEFEGDLLPPLAVGVSSDAFMKYVGDNSDNQEVTAYVQNISGATATNVKATLELPAGLKLISGTATRTIGTMTNNSDKQIDWVIGFDTQSPEISYEIKVKVTADGCADKVVKKNINVEYRAKKAILVVPGIAGSKLYLKTHVTYGGYFYPDGSQLWEPSILNLRDRIRMLEFGPDGRSLLDIESEGTGAEREYGAQGYYTDLVKALEATYKRDYQVLFWGYDWRQDVSSVAEDLQKYIDDKGYTEVILVCHSMGGLVASKYLANSTANRNKTKKLITLGTPYLGAPKAWYVFETGELLTSIAGVATTPAIKDIANNFPSVYELLPSENYFDLNGTTYIYTKQTNPKKHWSQRTSYTKKHLDYDETMKLINTRSWGNMALAIKARFFANSLFTQGNQITGEVDSYYIIGYGKKTLMQVMLNYDEKGNCVDVSDLTYLKGGDETVPMISANIGGLAPADKIYYVKDSHTGMLDNEAVITMVKNIIDGNPTSCPEDITQTKPASVKSKDLKIKVECPVDLTMVDENGAEWAHVSPEEIYNEKPDDAVFAVFGKDNDKKMAVLEDEVYNVKLLGTGTGVMTYTFSVLESDFEESIELFRVVFENVPVTETAIITTTTDHTGEYFLNMDEDGDGIVDYKIYPTRVMDAEEIEEYENGTDIQLELSEISAITSSKDNAISVNGTNVTFENDVITDGTCTFYTGKDVELDSEYNSIAKLYQNGTKKATNHEVSYEVIAKAVDNYFANVEDALPRGANSYGTTDAFYNITAPITNIVTENSVVMSTQKLASVKDCVVYSRSGNVSAYVSDMDFDGVIYAPNGTVTIYGSNIRIHGAIIADKIVINGQNVIFD